LKRKEDAFTKEIILAAAHDDDYDYDGEERKDEQYAIWKGSLLMKTEAIVLPLVRYPVSYKDLLGSITGKERERKTMKTEQSISPWTLCNSWEPCVIGTLLPVFV